MFWKKNESEKSREQKIVLGMVMLNDERPVKLENFLEDFRLNYGDIITGQVGEAEAFVFTVNGENAAIAYVDFPIPADDIKETAEYAYNWVNAFIDTKSHKSHLIVSLMQGSEDQVKRFKIFTQILCSLLRTTNAIGVYMGNQSLLIPKADFLNEAEFMSGEYLPLNLWINFGLRKTDIGNSGYTYGLKEFGKTEMEIVYSSKSLEEIRGFLYNTAHYVLDHDVTFQDNQTVGVSQDEKIAIRFSKGKFLEDKTFKLEY